MVTQAARLPCCCSVVLGPLGHTIQDSDTVIPVNSKLHTGSGLSEPALQNPAEESKGPEIPCLAPFPEFPICGKPPSASSEEG